MSTKTYTDFNAGERVEGTYYGLPFTGTIASLRWHSIRNDVREVLVNTDGFQYKSEPRERLLGAWARTAGSPMDLDNQRSPTSSLPLIASEDGSGAYSAGLAHTRRDTR
jgi:hypothetical protein